MPGRRGASRASAEGDEYWQFNWKMPKAYDDQCQRMVLTLGDGSTHEAVFPFKEIVKTIWHFMRNG